MNCENFLQFTIIIVIFAIVLKNLKFPNMKNNVKDYIKNNAKDNDKNNVKSIDLFMNVNDFMNIDDDEDGSLELSKIFEGRPPGIDPKLDYNYPISNGRKKSHCEGESLGKYSYLSNCNNNVITVDDNLCESENATFYDSEANDDFHDGLSEDKNHGIKVIYCKNRKNKNYKNDENNKNKSIKFKEYDNKFHNSFFKFRETTHNNSSFYYDPVDRMIDLKLSGLNGHSEHNFKIGDIFDNATVANVNKSGINNIPNDK